MSKIPPFNPIEFAEQLDATNDYAVHDGQMLHWCGTHWRTVHEDDIKRKALRWLRQDTVWPVSASNARSAYETALLHFPTLKTPDAECTIIPLMNGYLHIEDAIMRLEPHDKACGQMYVLDCSYDAGAPAPTEFSRFLARVLPDEAVRQRVQEYVGYTLTADARHQRAHLWLGSGANGKGVLANIVQALHARTAAVQLDNLEGFSMSDMVGASLLYCDEAPLRGINEKILKSVIAGEKVSIDIKYRAPISTCLTGKLLVLANHIPVVTDQSQGFWRRWDIVPFDVVIPPAERDSLLAKRIIKHELTGVLNWALEGLMRLVARGRFDEQLPFAIQRASESAKVETNSVAAWVKEAEIELSTVIDTSKVVVYEHYAAWCKANGMIAVASPQFWKRIPDVLGGAILFCRHKQAGGYRRDCNIRLSAN
ncbi:putative DNA primase/helicase [Herbaspirillum sp. 1173]|uniref:DNA primase family protein n=1 Tax=Herbaspirillum sp. 1173 TaxID=2817734 RepID=UPI0028600D81|nr:phage/plasmid primase, P4 family [Herbaspirillum sp. 1173]MDR6739118.1 putative DNA primase/helicase [Herbaspirillum sp. 1173]